MLWNPYSAGSLHLVNPGTCRGIWRHTRSSACLAGRYPKAALRIRSSRWGWWRSTPQSCGGWWRKWGRSEPAGSFYKRDFSAGEGGGGLSHVSFALVIKPQWIPTREKKTHQLLIAKSGWSHSWGDSSFAWVLHQRLSETITTFKCWLQTADDCSIPVKDKRVYSPLPVVVKQCGKCGKKELKWHQNTTQSHCAPSCFLTRSLTRGMAFLLRRSGMLSIL